MARSFLNTVSLAFYSHLFVWHIIFVPYSLRCYHTGEWRWLRQHPSTNICPCFLPRMMRLPRLWQICAWLTWARIWSVSVRSAPMALCASERLFSSHRSWQTSCWPRWPLKVNLYLQIHSPAGKTCWLLRLQNHCCFFFFFKHQIPACVCFFYLLLRQHPQFHCTLMYNNNKDYSILYSYSVSKKWYQCNPNLFSTFFLSCFTML